MLIMNERQFVKDCISGKIDPLELKFSRVRMISLLSSYFDNDKKNVNTIISLMEDFYQEEFSQGPWIDLTERVIRTQLKNNQSLIEREFIPIYQSDIDIIQSLQNEKQQKLMFTAFVLARYQDKDGWIGLYRPKDIKDFFKLANVTLSTTNRYLMLGNLEKEGYFTGARKNDNINEKVNIENDGIEVMRIYVLKNLGNQYLDKYKQGWKMCENCMKMIRIGSSAGRPRKYCNVCSLIVHQRQDREYQRKKRAGIDKNHFQ